MEPAAFAWFCITSVDMVQYPIVVAYLAIVQTHVPCIGRLCQPLFTHLSLSLIKQSVLVLYMCLHYGDGG